MTLDICMICNKKMPHALIPNICPDCYTQQKQQKDEARVASRT